MGRTGKRAVFSQAELERAQAIVEEVHYGNPLLMALAVLLAGKLKLTGEQIASVLGVSKPTVVRMCGRFRRRPEGEKSNWGGDRRSRLLAEARQEVLAGMQAEAAAGKIVTVEKVKAAIEHRCGSPVSLQTAYNILHREGWRKVRPDKAHPKSDREKQDEFKKRALKQPWSWLPPPPKPPIGRSG